MFDWQPSQLIKNLEAIEEIKGVNAGFLAHCRAAKQPKSLPTRLDVIDDSTLSIDCLIIGDAKASARFVRGPEDTWWAEYIFKVAFQETQLEIWRFYLSSGGHLVEKVPVDLDHFFTARTICQSTNTQIADRLCELVLKAALGSRAASPSEPPLTG